MGGDRRGFAPALLCVGGEAMLLAGHDVDGRPTQQSCSSLIEPNARSNRTGSAMQVAGPREGRTEGSTVVFEAPHGEHQSLRQRPNPMPRSSPGARGGTPRRRRAAGLRRRGHRAAEYIRRSTGIAHDERGREAAIEDRAWPRLLLWVFACAALVVSLVIRAEGLDDRDPRSAVRAPATEGSWEVGLPMLSSILQQDES